MIERETLLKVLDLARWAPSGDNTQPWRFEIAGVDELLVRGFDTREHVLYDFDGHPSHMAHGALLETLRIAATGFGLEAEWRIDPECPEQAPVYRVVMREAPGLPVDPLFPFIESRVVQRRMMRTTPLTEALRRQLVAAPGPAYDLVFFESVVDRLKVARLLWNNARIRLTCPEAFEVHREIIEWGARFSKDRIPEQAVGVDPLTGRLMQWALQRWSRVDFMNRYLLGTVAPRLQLDLLPAVACAAHVLLRPRAPLRALVDYVQAGVAMQRLWLTVTANGLHLQPEMTPLIFRWYVRAGRRFSAVASLNRQAARLADELESLAGAGPGDELAFMCRVGHGAVPSARSTRKDLSELLIGAG